MWIFKKKPKHISLEGLSEYLDGGLSDADIRKVEDHLRTCESCTEELDSLRNAVGLLRQTPVIPTRRDFTFVEAPESALKAREPIAAVGFPGFRVPVWAYGAAASVAVVAFAITLSIDLTRGPENGDGTVLVSEEGGEFSQQLWPIQKTCPQAFRCRPARLWLRDRRPTPSLPRLPPQRCLKWRRRRFQHQL